MKVSYKGIKHDLPAALQEKLDTRFAKLSKLIDGNGEKRAHVIVTGERHLRKAEITVHTRYHELVGVDSDPDLFNAISGALDKIGKQAVKLGAKFRSATRRSEPMKTAAAKPEAAPAKAAPKAPPAPATPRVFRPNHHERRKPSRSMRRCCRWRTAAIIWSIATPTSSRSLCWSAAATATST